MDLVHIRYDDKILVKNFIKVKVTDFEIFVEDLCQIF